MMLPTNVAQGRPVEGILDLKRRTGVRDVSKAADADMMNCQLPIKAIAASALVDAISERKQKAMLTDEVIAMATAAQRMPPPDPMPLSTRIRAGIADPSPVEDASYAVLSRSLLLHDPPRTFSHQLANDSDCAGNDFDGGYVAPSGSSCAIVLGIDKERGCILAATPAAKTLRDAQTKNATADVVSAPGAGDAVSSLLPISERKRSQNKAGADLIRAKRGRHTSSFERNGSADDIKRGENDVMIPVLRNTDARDDGGATDIGRRESRDGAFGETYRGLLVSPRSRHGGSFVDGAMLNPWGIESDPHCMSSSSGERPNTGEKAMAGQTVTILDPGDSVGGGRCAEKRGGGSCHLSLFSLGCDKYLGGIFLECGCQSDMEHQILLPKSPIERSPPRLGTGDVSKLVDDTGFTTDDRFAEWPGQQRDCSGLCAVCEVAGCSQSSATMASPISTVRPKSHHLQQHHQQEREQQRRRQRKLEQAVSSCCCSRLPMNTWHLRSGRLLKDETAHDEFAPLSVVMDRTHGGDFGTTGSVSPQSFRQSLMRPAACNTPTAFLSIGERASSSLHVGNMASTFSYSSPSCCHQYPHSAYGATTSGIQELDTFIRNTNTRVEDQHANSRVGPSEIARRASSHEGGHVKRGGDDSTVSTFDTCVVPSSVDKEQSPDACFGVFCAVESEVLLEDLEEMNLEELVLTQRQEAELINCVCAGDSGSGVEVGYGISSSDIVGDTPCFTKGMIQHTSSTGSGSKGEGIQECPNASNFVTSTRCDRSCTFRQKSIRRATGTPSRHQL